MATVIIQKRNRKKGTTYPIFFKDPMTGKKKYYKTLQRLRDAQQSANDLRMLLDAGKVAEVKNSKRKISLLTFEEVCRSLKKLYGKDGMTGQNLVKQVTEAIATGSVCLKGSSEIGSSARSTHNEIVEYRNRVASKTSNLTSNRSLFILKQIFKQGMEMNAIKNDPVAAMSYLSEKKHVRNEFLTASGIGSPT